MDKYLSIITNFGCHYNCHYCIVKNTGIKTPKTTISGLNNLLATYYKNNCNIISLSGGGDPLFDYSRNFSWYNKFFEITKGIRKELHTSYVTFHNPILKNFYRIVYHLRDVNMIPKVHKSSGKQKIRVVFVVDETFSPEKIDKIYKMVKENPDIDELSFRQMVDKNYNTTNYCYDYLMKYHKDRWYYILQDDYNLYYAENKVFHHYNDLLNSWEANNEYKCF